jgi:hypothetical protein
VFLELPVVILFALYPGLFSLSRLAVSPGLLSLSLLAR